MASSAIPTGLAGATPTTVGPANTPRLLFVELESKDAVVRFWATKAVQVLENPELSAKGRVRIVQDIQERIAARLAQLGEAGRAKGKKASASPAAKPAGLGCPKQMARLRESFKQFEEPKAEVVPTPVKKVRLAPRAPRGA